MTQSLRLVTHGGSFHCDDVMGFVILRHALGLDQRTDWSLVRTRDPQTIADADIVWDVGASADAGAGRCDHHMAGAPARPCGTPYSSAGLLWLVHGRRAATAVLGRDVNTSIVERVWLSLDRDLIRLIDMADNGCRPEIGYADPAELAAADGMALPMIVDGFNPPWDAIVGLSPAERDEIQDQCFRAAAMLVSQVLVNRIHGLRAGFAADDAVIAAYGRSADNRVLELDAAMPWQDAVHRAGLPTLLAVYPAGDTWMVNCMPPRPGSFEQKLPLPASWAGLRDAGLARESGVPDAVFCHKGRFIAGAGSRDGALRLARLALMPGSSRPAHSAANEAGG